METDSFEEKTCIRHELSLQRERFFLFYFRLILSFLP